MLAGQCTTHCLAGGAYHCESSCDKAQEKSSLCGGHRRVFNRLWHGTRMTFAGMFLCCHACACTAWYILDLGRSVNCLYHSHRVVEGEGTCRACMCYMLMNSTVCNVLGTCVALMFFPPATLCTGSPVLGCYLAPAGSMAAHLCFTFVYMMGGLLFHVQLPG